MTPEMRRTLTNIQEHYAAHGIAPSIRELASMEGLKSPGGVHRRVQRLIGAGYLVRTPGHDRNFAPADAVLSTVPTDQLRAELDKREKGNG